MNIKEIREKSKILKNKIHDLLKEFEEETDTMINKVDIIRMYGGHKKSGWIADTELDVKIKI